MLRNIIIIYNKKQIACYIEVCQKIKSFSAFNIFIDIRGFLYMWSWIKIEV